MTGGVIEMSLRTLRRDLRTVADAVLGRSPPPFAVRKALPRHGHTLGPPVARTEALAPRTVRIAEVTRDTADAVSLHLEDVTGRPFDFHPGQFLTLLVPVDGSEPVRRAYSLCTAPDGGPRVVVTVKRVERGRISNHLVDHAKVGDVLAALGPSGSFGVHLERTARRHLVLVAGGSGITPMMSVARTVLAHEPGSRLSLLYGNRSEATVLFARALADLADTHGERFVVRHVLERPSGGASLPSGRSGRLDRAVAGRELAALGVAEADLVLVCGPEPMMAAVREALTLDLGVPSARVLEERFSSPAQRSTGAPPLRSQPISIRLRGRTHEVTATPGQTVLDAGLAAGLAMPYSCAMGGCGACRLKLIAGAVVEDEPNCLTEQERAAGFVLGCGARATCSTTVEVP